MSRIIDYYFSFISPWSFLGHATILEVARRNGATIRLFPVDPRAVFTDTGPRPVANRSEARQRYRIAELQRWGVKRQLEFNLQPRFWPFDYVLADRVAVAAAHHGVAEALMPRFFSAVWQREENLADPQVIVALLNEVGLDGPALLEEAMGEEAESGYGANRMRALNAGVFGLPSYVLDGEMFRGQDRIDLLEDALVSGRQPFVPA